MPANRLQKMTFTISIQANVLLVVVIERSHKNLPLVLSVNTEIGYKKLVTKMSHQKPVVGAAVKIGHKKLLVFVVDERVRHAAFENLCSII